MTGVGADVCQRANIWQFRDDSDAWIAFSDTDAASVNAGQEDARAKGRPSFAVSLGPHGFQYTIDLDNMVQINQHNGKRRELRCLTKGLWQFESDDTSWINFSAGDTAMLERLYASDCARNATLACACYTFFMFCSPSRNAMRHDMQLGPHNFYYRVNFSEMIQVNMQTGRRRRLRRNASDGAQAVHQAAAPAEEALGPYDRFNDPHALVGYVTECGVDLVRFGWFRELQSISSPFVRNQELPKHAFSTLEDIERRICAEEQFRKMTTLVGGIIAISHPWLSRSHPDPAREHLAQICQMSVEHTRPIDDISSRWYPQIPDDAASFIDYMSLPQLKFDSDGRIVEGRTVEAEARFRKCLEHMHVLYAHERAYVLCLDGSIPDLAASRTPYQLRGWCQFEFRAFNTKNSARRSERVCEEGAGRTIVPLLPTEFDDELRTTLQFTTKADVRTVSALYRKVFNASLSQTRVFTFSLLQSMDLQKLPALMWHYHQLERISFCNVICDDTSIFTSAIGQVLHDGAAPKLREVSEYPNPKLLRELRTVLEGFGFNTTLDKDPTYANTHTLCVGRRCT